MQEISPVCKVKHFILASQSTIIWESGEFELRVAFQGELGAYSEMAVYSFFGESVEVKPCKSFDEVFESVKTGDVNYGVVPIENSIEGSVNRTYDLFLEYDLKVCGEIIIRISHCLIAHKGTKLDQIKTIWQVLF